MLQQNLSQLDTHAPAAGELAAGSRQVLAFETQTRQGAVGFCFLSCVVIALQDLVQYVLVIAVQHDLRQIADTQVFVPAHRTARRLLFAGYETQ